MKQQKFTVVDVQRIAFNNERILLEGKDATITINLKNADDHGEITKGKTIEFGVISKADKKRIDTLEQREADLQKRESDLAQREAAVAAREQQ